MTKFEKFLYKHIHFLRRFVQLATLAFLFLVPALNKYQYNVIIGTFYSISIGNLDIVDPALMFQHILLTKSIYFPLLLAGIIPLIIALIFGKVFCSWVCPFNLFAEYTDKIRKFLEKDKKIRFNKNPKPHYYWFIFGFIISFVAISGLPIITLISFPGLISGQIADLVFFGTIGIEIIIILLIVTLEIFFKPRFWCKFACPVGATLGLLRYNHSLAIQYDAKICAENCPTDKKLKSLCNSACPIELNPRQLGIYPYCINCGECIAACQNKGEKAISFTFNYDEKKRIYHPKKIIESNINETRSISYGN
jgi:ferredoxin-type protein NapH